MAFDTQVLKSYMFGFDATKVSNTLKMSGLAPSFSCLSWA